MFKYIIIGFIILFMVKFRKTKIKYKTFFKKGFRIEKKQFGVYCYCGKQGKGKTYSVVEFLNNNKLKLPIYANISSINSIDYKYFSGFDELLKLRDKTDCIIVYDEIFTALTKSTKLNSEVLDFLSQMRKRRIIFLTTAQEWLEINITLRRYCKYQVECNIVKFFNIGILIKRFYDAEQLKWDNDENEYIAPLIETSISKCLLSVANSYDTYERISTKNYKEVGK